MADSVVREVKARLRLDTSDLEKGQVASKKFASTTKSGVAGANKELSIFESRLKASAILIGENSRQAEMLSSKVTVLSKLSGGAGVGGFLGGMGTIGGIAAAGVAVEGAKSAIEISEKREAAEKGLAQALSITGRNQQTATRFLDGYIASNRSYIKDQNEVITGYAQLTRAGLSEDKVQRDLSIATDLAAIKHISLSEAVDVVVKAENGRFRGLIDLGISTKSITADMGDEKQGADKVAIAMQELAEKTKDGRKSTTDMDQASNRLGNDWQDLAVKVGPSLIGMMDTVVDRADKIYQSLDALGKNDAWWKGLNDGLINVARAAQDAFNWVNNLSSLGAVNIPSGQGQSRTSAYEGAAHRAAGGTVIPGRIYDVGEDRPERLYMLPGGGGVVVPSGDAGDRRGGTTINLNLTLHGAGAADDPEGVRRTVQRMAAIGLAS